MSNFKEYFTYDCISYTIITLLYCILAKINIFHSVTPTDLLQLFVMTSCAVILMFFTNKHFSNTIFQMIIVNIIDIFISVFVLGAVFRMIDLTFTNILSVSAMIVIAYFGVFGVTIIRYQADAICINNCIKKSRNREREDTHE